MKKSILILVAICMVFMMVSCSTSGSATSSAPASSSAAVPSESTEAAASASPSASPSISSSSAAVEITIAAAASLTDVSKEIADAYKIVAPDVTLTFTYGSSGALQTQIEQGAPVDIFMSAAQKQMDALNDKKLLSEGSRFDLLENKVVLIAPIDSDKAIASFEDIATDRVDKVSLGDPASVPAGQYAEEVFTSLNILDQVKEKANYGTDVRQVLTWVESGDVDCGVVYATDAATSDKVKVICEAPEGSVKKITYPVAILESSTHAIEAQSFLEYLKTPEIAAIFEKYGFIMAE